MNIILIVEDNPKQRQFLIENAQHINPNLKILETDSIREAKKMVKEYDINTFIIDIQLIDGNGLELAKYIREKLKYQFTPIVFITGVPTKEMEAFHDIHCYDYILKPFTRVTIEKVMNSILIDYMKKEKVETRYLCLDFKGLKQKVNIDDILYIENLNRKIYIVTKYEEISYKYISLRVFMKELPDDFIQTHQSFVVNKNYICKINQCEKSINLLGTDVSIPIGISYKKKVGEQINGII